MTLETAASAASSVSANPAKLAPIYALFGGGGVALAISLAAIVVMVLKRPRTVGEWAVALISTIVSSLCLGAFVVIYLGLHRDLRSVDPIEVYAAVVQMGGVIFACGLPGWVLVRMAFNTMAKVQDKSLDQVYHDAKELL